MKKVVVLVENNFTARDHERFGISIFERYGFIVEIWDITPLTNPKLFISSNDRVYENHIIFYSYSKIVKRLRKLNLLDLIITFFSFSYKHHRILRAITKFKLRYCVPRLGVVPAPIYNNNFIRMINVLKNNSLLELLLNNIYKRILRKISRIKSPNIYLLSGEKSFDLCLSNGEGVHTRYIWGAALDYSHYLKNRATSNQHIVFLDEYEPFHPDFKIFKCKPLSPFPYYHELNSTFLRFEEKFQIPVVVAAHPRSEYEKHPKYFEERRVVRGQTVDLIRNAKLVLAHTSTAIQMAILYKKPIILLTSNEMNQTYKKNIFPAYTSRELCLPIINMSNGSFVIPNIDTISDKGYEEYICNYVKTKNAPGQSAWETLIMNM